jgi:hypothetical protein
MRFVAQAFFKMGKSAVSILSGRSGVLSVLYFFPEPLRLHQDHVPGVT